METVIELLGTVIIFADELFDVNNKRKTPSSFLLPVLVYLVGLAFFLMFLFLFISILSLFFHTPSLAIGLSGGVLLIACLYFGYKMYGFSLGLWDIFISIRNNK